MPRSALRHVAPILVALIAGALAACRGAAPAAQPSGAAADSLVLERTPCFGSCPAYRLSVSRSGAVAFASRNRGDDTRAASQVAPTTLATLVERARGAGFFALPTRLRDDRALCPLVATDHPTVHVTIFAADTTHRVEDYHGCHADTDRSVVPALAGLRALEDAVDSAAGSARWVRPNGRR
jgi:hypothetical protein